jgi:hypothetical protein
MKSASNHCWRKFAFCALTIGILLLPAVAGAHPGHVHPDEKDEFDALTAAALQPLSSSDYVMISLSAAVAGGFLCFRNRRRKFAH